MLLSSDRQVIPHEHRPEMELLHADLRRVADSFPELYWQAPPSYLGDRVSRGIWFEGLYFEGRKCSGVLGKCMPIGYIQGPWKHIVEGACPMRVL